MTKKLWLGLGIAALGVGLFNSHGANAGAKNPLTVTVDGSPLNRFYGTLGSARNSADTVQYIGCSTDNIDGNCTAKNSAGTVVTCFSTDPEIIDVMRACTTDSYLFVEHDGAGTCTRVVVGSRSSHAPKNP